MANSKRYKLLIERINFLNKNILPEINIYGDYSPIEFDFTRSYVLLTHAEIEGFLEDRVRDKVLSALKNWNENRKKSHCLKSIMAFCGNDVSFSNKTSIQTTSLPFRVNYVASHFQNQIKKNHGIKRENILNLLLPIGIELNQIDETWLTTMDNFGSSRGEIAHNTLAVQNPIDPKTQRDLINVLILPELKKIDLSIVKLT